MKVSFKIKNKVDMVTLTINNKFENSHYINNFRKPRWKKTMKAVTISD